MPEMKDYPAGTFCWIDLATTDPENAKQFYTQVFGWDAQDVPAGDAGVYTMFSRGGKSVCALYQLSEQMQRMGIPPHWQSYVSVDDVEASAKKAAQLGATVMAPPFDVMDAGRMTAIADPDGALLALWQAKTHPGAALVNEPGAWCWNELYAKDTGAASTFYNGLFGWTTNTSKSPTGDDYFEFKNGERSVGGMMKIKPEWGEMPPNWSIYLAVADLDATLDKAKRLGAKIEVGPMEVPRVGTFAFIQDPQGAYGAVIQLLPEAVQT